MAYLTFLGPLIGSLIRPVGGWLADRFGGARTTFSNFVGMHWLRWLVLIASLQKSLPLFLAAFIALFVLSGIGNGSTYKMIPAIFRSQGAGRGRRPAPMPDDRRPRRAPARGRADRHRRRDRRLRRSAGEHRVPAVVPGSGNGNAAYIGFIAFYVACSLLTWGVYLRRSTAPARRRLIDPDARLRLPSSLPSRSGSYREAVAAFHHGGDDVGRPSAARRRPIATSTACPSMLSPGNARAS